MHMQHLALMAVVGVAAGQTPSTLVVPAAHAMTDGASFVWVPGACDDVRQQTLIGAAHLTPMVGSAISAMELRRTAAAEAYQGGSAALTVSLSTTLREPIACSELFAENSGTNCVQVFQGTVAIPTSPATTGITVPWSSDNVIRIVFQQPFVYSGGTLCVDITGLAIGGQNATWWMADAAMEPHGGTVMEVGAGCGPRSGGSWSLVSPETLVPGLRAEMDAYGTPGNWAVAAVGPAISGFPLQAIQLGQLGCFGYLGDIYLMQVAQFQPFPEMALQPRGGLAEFRPQIPSASWVLGVQLTTQWLDLVDLVSSNAITWTIDSAMPTLDMALVDGMASDVGGSVTTNLAHVLRFEYQ